MWCTGRCITVKFCQQWFMLLFLFGWLAQGKIELETKSCLQLQQLKTFVLTDDATSCKDDQNLLYSPTLRFHFLSFPGILVFLYSPKNDRARIESYFKRPRSKWCIWSSTPNITRGRKTLFSLSEYFIIVLSWNDLSRTVLWQVTWGFKEIYMAPWRSIRAKLNIPSSV